MNFFTSTHLERLGEFEIRKLIDQNLMILNFHRLPKAAVITHSRYIYIAAAIHKVADFQDEDIYYSPLPLYHTAAGCMSIGQMLIFGSTVVIRRKFSASAFFSDCAKYNATVS
jgi:solute carrier family 27 (fatty acid transporter), member 1/4